jgi:hypothetical protein
MIPKPFAPSIGKNVALSLTTAQSTIVYLGTTTGASNSALRVVNSGTGTAYVRVSRTTDTTVASTADTPVRANSELILFIGQIGESCTLRATAVTTATLDVQPGEGSV